MLLFPPLVVLALIIQSTFAQQSPRVFLKIVGHNAVCVGGDNDGARCARGCDCPDGVCEGTPFDPYDVWGSPGDEFIIEAYAEGWSPSDDDPELLERFQTPNG